MTYLDRTNFPGGGGAQFGRGKEVPPLIMWQPPSSIHAAHVFYYLALHKLIVNLFLLQPAVLLMNMDHQFIE